MKPRHALVLALSVVLTLFGFSYGVGQAELVVSRLPPVYQAIGDLPSVLAFVEAFDSTHARDLAMLDLFSGLGNMFRAWDNRGFSANRVDIGIGGYHHNILTREGFYYTLKQVLRIMPFGFLWCGPPCSWLIFLSFPLHKRTRANPSGDESREEVRSNNVLVENVALV